jgi:hypothetical protein
MTKRTYKGLTLEIVVLIYKHNQTNQLTKGDFIMNKFDIINVGEFEMNQVLRELRESKNFATFQNTRSQKARVCGARITDSGRYYVVDTIKKSYYFPTTHKNPCTLIKNFKGKGFIQKPLTKKVS